MQCRVRKTADDYFRLEDGPRVELIEGEFYLTAAPTTRHQLILGNLHLLIRPQIDRLGLGTFILSPFDAVLSPEDVVQPDLVFVSKANASRLRDHLVGPPDLAIEVLSLHHAERDRLVKKNVYFRFGVPEYWMVDPSDDSIEVLVRAKTGWKTHGIFAKGDHLTSLALPGVTFRVDDVFPPPQPEAG